MPKFPVDAPNKKKVRALDELGFPNARGEENYNENIHPETQLPIEGDSYVTKDGKVVNLRAYQFRNLEHFFDLQETNDENKNARLTLKDYLRNAAKNSISFDQILNQNAEDTTVKIGTLLEDQVEQYMMKLLQII